MSPSQFMCSLAGSVQTAHCATTLTTALMGTSELSWNKPTLRAHTVFCKTEKQSSFKSLSSLPLKTIRRDLKNKNSNTGLCKKAIIPSGKKSQTRQVFQAQDKRDFQARNCQHSLHPLVWNNYFSLSILHHDFKRDSRGFLKGPHTFFENFLLSKHFFITQLST